MSFKRLNWIDDAILPLAVLGLRLCWLWPWLELLRRWITPHITTPFLPLWMLVLLGVGGYVSARRALGQETMTRNARAFVIGAGLVAVLIGVWLHQVGLGFAPWDPAGFNLLIRQATDWTFGPPPAFMGLVVGVGLWIAGVRDATPLSRHEQLWTTFTVGFVAFVLMLLVVQLDDRGMPPGTGAGIWLFFGVGMAALALSALEYAGLGQDKDAGVPGISRYWIGSMLAVVGGILGIALILGLVLAPGTVAAVLGNLRFLLDWLGAILGIILIVIAYLIFLIIEPLFNLLREYMELPEPEEDSVDTQSLNEMLDAFYAEPSSILPEAVADSLPWVALLLTVLALAIAVTIALRILRRTPEQSFVETRESVFSSDLLQEQLSSLWSRLMGKEEADTTSPFLSLAGEEERRQRVRAIYQAFLAQMEQAGHPRAPQLTPAAYGLRLQGSRLWRDVAARQASAKTRDNDKDRDKESDKETPTDSGSVDNAATPQAETEKASAEKAAIEVITTAYVQARYGDTAPSPQEVEAAEQAWARLQAALNIPGEGGVNGHPPN